MLVHRYRAAVEVVQGGEIIPGPAVQQHEIHDKYAHKCRCTLRGVNRNLRVDPHPELILVAVLAEAKIRRVDQFAEISIIAHNAGFAHQHHSVGVVHGYLFQTLDPVEAVHPPLPEVFQHRFLRLAAELFERRIRGYPVPARRYLCLRIVRPLRGHISSDLRREPQPLRLAPGHKQAVEHLALILGLRHDEQHIKGRHGLVHSPHDGKQRRRIEHRPAVFARLLITGAVQQLQEAVALAVHRLHPEADVPLHRRRRLLLLAQVYQVGI